jgi:translation initiation factor IF-3
MVTTGWLKSGSSTRGRSWQPWPRPAAFQISPYQSGRFAIRLRLRQSPGRAVTGASRYTANRGEGATTGLPAREPRAPGSGRPCGLKLFEEQKPIATGQRSSRQSGPNTRINSLITAKTVRVIDSENEQLGILELQVAIKQAQDAGLDLVEVAPGADPPVCRIMDYGQYKYQQSKRLHEAKRNQKVVHLKEIKMRPKTEDHDFQFKLKHALEFLEEGDKVKVTVVFRGRELSHQELGRKLMERFVAHMAETATVETTPRMEGRTLTAVLTPKKK